MLAIQGADQKKKSSQDTTKVAVSWWEKSLRSRWEPTPHGAIQPGTIAPTWSFPISIKRFYQYAFVIPNKQRSSLSCWSQGLTFTSDQTSHSGSSVNYKMHKMPLSTGGLSGFKRRPVCSVISFVISLDISCGTFLQDSLICQSNVTPQYFMGHPEGVQVFPLLMHWSPQPTGQTVVSCVGIGQETQWKGSRLSADFSVFACGHFSSPHYPGRAQEEFVAVPCFNAPLRNVFSKVMALLGKKKKKITCQFHDMLHLR